MVMMLPFCLFVCLFVWLVVVVFSLMIAATMTKDRKTVPVKRTTMMMVSSLQISCTFPRCGPIPHLNFRKLSCFKVFALRKALLGCFFGERAPMISELPIPKPPDPSLLLLPGLKFTIQKLSVGAVRTTKARILCRHCATHGDPGRKHP